MFAREEIVQLALNTGFHRVRILNTEDSGSTFPAGSLLLCALSCYRDEPEDLSEQGNPHGQISPFARRNYYAESVSRLKNFFKDISGKTGFRKQDVRIFCNSRLPEKQLAARAGLGFYGRNSLIIAQGLGSLFVISGLYLPIEYKSDPPLVGNPLSGVYAPGSLCKKCRACIEGCPVGAISETGEIDEAACLQSLSTRCTIFPDHLKETWQYRIYGCQVCQTVCPYNRDLSLTTCTDSGLLGPSLPIRELLERRPDALRRFLRPTTLGQAWIPMEALQRNALLVAGNRLDPEIRPLLADFLERKPPFLRDAAEWAIGRLKKSH